MDVLGERGVWAETEVRAIRGCEGEVARGVLGEVGRCEVEAEAACRRPGRVGEDTSAEASKGAEDGPGWRDGRGERGEDGSRSRGWRTGRAVWMGESCEDCRRWRGLCAMGGEGELDASDMRRSGLDMDACESDGVWIEVQPGRAEALCCALEPDGEA